MATRILQQKIVRTTQPQDNGEPDYSHPFALAMGLDFVWNGSNPGVVWRGGNCYQANTLKGTSTVRAGRQAARGVYQSAGASEYIDLGYFKPFTELTVIVIAEGSSVNNLQIACNTASASHGFDVLFGSGGVAGSNVPLRIGTGSVNRSAATKTGLNDGQTHVYGGCWASGEDVYGWVDGVSVGTEGLGAYTGTITPSQNLYIGRRGTTYFTGFTGLVLVGRKRAPADVLRSLGENPWQIFAPTTQQIFLPSVAAPKRLIQKRIVRTTQPQGNARIDWSNPITRGLLYAVLPSGTILSGFEGLYFGAGKTNLGSVPSLMTCTLMGVALRRANASTFRKNYVISIGALGSNTPSLAIGTLGTATPANTAIECRAFTNNSSSPTANTAAGYLPTTAGQMNVLVATYESASTTGLNSYVDGVLAATGTTATADGIRAQNLTVSTCDNGTNSQTDIIPSVAAVWNRALSAVELASISANPWQIFAPIEQDIWLPLAGGTSPLAIDSSYSYAIRQLANSDKSLSYFIRTAISQSIATAYNVRTTATQDENIAYLVRSGILSDINPVYVVRGVSASDINASYVVRSVLNRDINYTYYVRTLATKDSAQAYNVRSAINSDKIVNYVVRTNTFSSLTTLYSILSATGIASNLLIDYSVRGLVTSSSNLNWAIRAAIITDVGTDYIIRTYTSADTAVDYLVRTSTQKDATASYKVRTLTNSDINIAYSVQGILHIVSEYQLLYNVLQSLSSTAVIIKIAEIAKVNITLETQIPTTVTVQVPGAVSIVT